MSGILAIMDLSGAPVDAGPLDAMLAASPHRGPDGSARIVVGSASLAHQAMRVTAEDRHDRQPISDTERGLHLAADARLYGREELIRDLADESLPAGRDATDAELILAAFRRWGTECSEHLVGDFAFVLWDAEHRRIFCARDALGVRPLYWARVGSLLVVASEAQQVLAHPAVPCRLDKVAAASFVAYLFDEEARTLFLDVRRLPAGHYLAAGSDGFRVRRYWDPSTRPTIRYRRASDYAEHYREIFTRAVGDRLRTASGPVGLYMSGGLDSCSIAATAASLGAAGNLVAESYAFDRHHSCDERRYIRPVASALGMQVEYTTVDRYPLLGDEDAYRPPLESPFLAWEDVHVEMRENLERRGARVVLTGHAGEYGSVGHDRILFPQRLLRGQGGVVAELRRYGRSCGVPFPRILSNFLLRPLLPARVVGALRRWRGHEVDPLVPDWIDPGLAARGRLAVRLAGLPAWLRLLRPDSPAARDRFRRLGDVGWAAAWHDRREACHGMEARHPFLDRRLVEFVARIPPEEVFRAGWTRVVLRRAMKGRLPDLVRLRPDKTSFAPYVNHCLRMRVRSRIEMLFDDPWLARLGIVDADGLRSAWERYLRAPAPLPYLWYAVAMELWLREYRGRFEGCGLSSESR